MSTHHPEREREQAIDEIIDYLGYQMQGRPLDGQTYEECRAFVRARLDDDCEVDYATLEPGVVHSDD